MHKGLLLFFLVALSQALFGQVNLVPNPSFENFDTCPNYAADIENAVPWFQPNNPSDPTWGSTEFFHACDTNFVDVPLNFIGHQYARTGSGYAGFGLFILTTDNYGHEYMEVKLMDSCLPDRKYCVSFYMVLAGSPWCLASSAVGAFFSVDTCQYISSDYNPINVIPQAINHTQNIITDTLNWQSVNMSFTAAGGERFMTIGNFWDTAYNRQHSLELCGPSAPYYYFDDVSVILLPELSAGVDDTLVQGDTVTLSGTISENWAGMQFEWLPHEGLADPYSMTTLAYPDSTTTYVLAVTCPTCDVRCLDEVHDSVTIIVQAPEPLQPAPLRVPTLFSNDQSFQIDGLQPNTRIKIFDTRGRLVYASDNYDNGYALVNLDPAIYLYEVKLLNDQTVSGQFLLIRK